MNIRKKRLTERIEKISLKVSGDAKIVKPLIEKYTGRLEIKEEKESLAKRRKHI